MNHKTNKKTIIAEMMNLLGRCSKRSFWVRSCWPANWHVTIGRPTRSSS